MSRTCHVLAIDQGTTSTRSIIFNASARAVSIARRDLEQYYPAAGWVEHDAEEIWQARRLSLRSLAAMILLPLASPISAKRPSSGNVRAASRFTGLSSGRTGARPMSAPSCARMAMRNW